MNSAERVRRRLTGEAVDRPPHFTILMQRAAHHAGLPLSRYYLDYRALVDANLAVLDTFHLDLVQTISDPFREAVDLGLDVEFPEDGLPIRRRPLLEETGNLARLHPIDPALGRRMTDRLDAIRILRERVGGTVPIMGWVEGALAEAADLRGESVLMLDLLDRPEWVTEVLEVLVEQAISFARAQVAAGADIIGLGDAIASLVSPQMYRSFALPYEQRIFEAVREAGAIPRLHICGNTSRIVADMAKSGASIIDLDWMVDLRAASAACAQPGGPALCGNFDPVGILLNGTPEIVRDSVLACAEHGGERWFCAAGCEVPDATPDANILAISQTLRTLGEPS